MALAGRVLSTDEVSDDFDIDMANTHQEMQERFSVGCPNTTNNKNCFVYLKNQYFDQTNEEYFKPREMTKRVSRTVIEL